jgi:hypothetical protein
MNLQIRNSETVYNFTDNDIHYNVRIGGLRRRLSLEKRYGKPGAKPVGDRQVDSRDFKINFNNVSEENTDADAFYVEKLAAIIGMFDLNLEPFYVEDVGPLQRRALVELDGLNDTPAAEGLFYRIGDNNIDLNMLDGFWEDLDSTVDQTPTGGIANGGSFLIDNDAQVETYPIITVSPYADNSEFTLTNTTTDALMTLSSAGFVVGTQFIIDCQTGNIYLDDGISRVELSSALADGSGFFTLAPGPNTFSYASLFGNVDITVEFRRRYAF